MKIDIGCCVDTCEENAFAEILCHEYDEPALGLFFPAGWGIRAATTPESGSFDFYCPQHNPALKKTDAEPDIDFHMASVVTPVQPAKPDWGKIFRIDECVGVGPLKPVTDPEQVVDLGESTHAKVAGEELYGHHHGTSIGPTQRAQYRVYNSTKHAHATPVGLTSWELETEDHTHKINIVTGNRTGLPIPREIEPTEKGLRGKKIAVVRRDEHGRVLVELEPGIEPDQELVKTMYVAWRWAHQAELEQYCQRQHEEREQGAE